MVAKAEKFTLNLVSPEKLVYSEEVEMANVPGEAGEFGVLPKHEAMISTLSPGLIEIFQNKKPKDHFFVGGGFVNVSDDVCNVLAEEVIHVSDINLEDLEQFIKDTRENIEMARSDEERQNLHSDLHLANAKVEIARRLMKK